MSVPFVSLLLRSHLTCRYGSAPFFFLLTLSNLNFSNRSLLLFSLLSCLVLFLVTDLRHSSLYIFLSHFTFNNRSASCFSLLFLSHLTLSYMSLSFFSVLFSSHLNLNNKVCVNHLCTLLVSTYSKKQICVILLSTVLTSLYSKQQVCVILLSSHLVSSYV